MPISDETLRKQVSRAWRRAAGADHSSFDSVWQLAQARHAAARRRYRGLASVAAVVAVIVVGVNLQLPEDETAYIEIADLLDSTYWSAPSDVLLPDREFDIYQDMPVLFESTEPAGGALL